MSDQDPYETDILAYVASGGILNIQLTCVTRKREVKARASFSISLLVNNTAWPVGNTAWLVGNTAWLVIQPGL